jgi:hypothetical protein
MSKLKMSNEVNSKNFLFEINLLNSEKIVKSKIYFRKHVKADKDKQKGKGKILLRNEHPMY